MKHHHVLLATEDAAVEAAVKAVTGADCELDCVRTRREALCQMMDADTGRFSRQELAVVDLDLHDGGRALLSTTRSVVPVIAITSKTRPWLASMLRRHRIGATLAKPVSPEALRDAFRRVGCVGCLTPTRRAWTSLLDAMGQMVRRFHAVAPGGPPGIV